MEDISEITIQQTPLTNPGCDTQFARFDNRVRVSDGSVSVREQSHKKCNTNEWVTSQFTI